MLRTKHPLWPSIARGAIDIHGKGEETESRGAEQETWSSAVYGWAEPVEIHQITNVK